MVLDICIIKLGFLAFIASVIYWYFEVYTTFYSLMRSYRYWIDNLIICSLALKKSNSKMESSLNSAFLIISSLPYFYVNTVKTAKNLLSSVWFLSFWKVLIITSGYSLKSMNMDWFSLIRLNYQSVQVKMKLK